MLTSPHPHDYTPLVEDSRFGFVYSPAADGQAGRPLVLAIHGSDRDITGMITALREGLGDRPVSILAPLFPARIGDEDHSDGYKFLMSGGIDYVALMQALMAAAPAPGGRFGPVYLFGFSGGAQFAERFALFSAAGLSGLVVAAPGSVTLLDAEIEWWPGLAGAGDAVGREPDLTALQRIPVEVLVGSKDLSAGLVPRGPGGPHGTVHEGLAGDSRIARARSLHASLCKAGIETGLHEIDGVAHELRPITLKAAGLIARWIDAAEQPHR